MAPPPLARARLRPLAVDTAPPPTPTTTGGSGRARTRLYLGRTREFTRTEGFVPMLEGRSSVGRLGLFIHVTAGFGDVGFAGYWTLEIFCVQPIVIYPGVELCQIYYHTIQGDYEPYRSGKYQNNQGIQPSLLYRDFEP